MIILNICNQINLGDLPIRAGDGDPIKGLNTVLDWSNTLSLGEQQRLAFGRLLVNQPRFVILDEATSVSAVNMCLIFSLVFYCHIEGFTHFVISISLYCAGTRYGRGSKNVQPTAKHGAKECRWCERAITSWTNVCKCWSQTKSENLSRNKITSEWRKGSFCGSD